MSRPNMSSMKLSRRLMLTGAAALAAPAVIGRRAAEAAERCVVGTWGGDYARLLKQNIGDPILKPEGVDVVDAVGDETPRMAKMFAQRRLPRGTFDIACLSGPYAYLTAHAGLLETLDEKKVPNLRHVIPLLHSGSFMPDQFVPHIYSPQGLAYNPHTVKDPPQTWQELLDPKWKGKVGALSSSAPWLIQGAALATTGRPDDFEAGKAFMLKLNANGLRLYSETDYMAPAFKSGEIVVSIIWLARTVMWQNGGFPVQGFVPKDGAVLYVTGMTMPKNAPDKDAAYKYMNALLEPSAQRGFAAHMGYLPTVDNADLTGKIAQQLALPKDAKLVQPNYEKVAAATPKLNDWWLKKILRK